MLLSLIPLPFKTLTLSNCFKLLSFCFFFVFPFSLPSPSLFVAFLSLLVDDWDRLLLPPAPVVSAFRLKVWILSSEVVCSSSLSLTLRWNLTLEVMDCYLNSLDLYLRVIEPWLVVAPWLEAASEYYLSGVEVFEFLEEFDKSLRLRPLPPRD